MEDYTYLQELNTDALVEMVRDMVDLEGAGEAMIIIETRAPEKALELGKHVLLNDEGDHYFQGLVFAILFYGGNEQSLIETLMERKKPLGRKLVDDIINCLTGRLRHIEIPEELFERIYETYESYDEAERRFMACDFEEFKREYSRELAEYRVRQENKGNR